MYTPYQLQPVPNKPKDITINKAYQCEQGQNYTMLITEVTLLATISWATWSLDSVLNLF